MKGSELRATEARGRQAEWSMKSGGVAREVEGWREVEGGKPGRQGTARVGNNKGEARGSRANMFTRSMPLLC